MMDTLELVRASSGAVFSLVAVKASVIAVVGLAITSRLFPTSAARRSARWTSVVAALLCLPLLGAVLPRITVRVDLPRGTPDEFAGLTTPAITDGEPRRAQSVHDSARPEAAKRPGGAIGWTTIAGTASLMMVMVWGVGSLALGARLLFGLFAARGLAQRAAVIPHGHPARAALATASDASGVTRRVELLLSHEVTVPSMFGLLRPRIILPAASVDWPADRLRAVLLHELAHVARRDYATRICWELTRVLYWVNPLVSRAAARARAEAERAADDRVLGAGTEPIAYAEQLLAVVRTVRPRYGMLTLGAASAPSALKERLRAILTATTDRRRATRGSSLGWAGPVIVAATSLAALGLEAVAGRATLRGVVVAPAVDGNAARPRNRSDSASWGLTASSTSRDSAAFQLLFASEPAARLAAARVVRALDSGAMLQDFVAVFGDTVSKCSAMRWRATRGLRELRDARALPHLVERLVTDPDSNVRAMAANAIAAAGPDAGARLLRVALRGAAPEAFGRVGRALDTLGDTRGHRTLLLALREVRAATRRVPRAGGPAGASAPRGT